MALLNWKWLLLQHINSSLKYEKENCRSYEQMHFLYVLSHRMNNSLDLLSIQMVDSFLDNNNNDAQMKYLSIHRQRCDKKKRRDFLFNYILPSFCLWFIHLFIVCIDATRTCMRKDLNKYWWLTYFLFNNKCVVWVTQVFCNLFFSHYLPLTNNTTVKIK